MATATVEMQPATKKKRHVALSDGDPQKCIRWEREHDRRCTGCNFEAECHAYLVKNGLLPEMYYEGKRPYDDSRGRADDVWGTTEE
jgi:hypothetical protein